MTTQQTQTLYSNGRHYDSRIKLTEDIPFWLDQARKYGDPILEIACGTGRISIPLAKEGYQVTGLDFTESMLTEARKKSAAQNQTINWVHGDCRDFDLDKKFNLIFIPFNSMSELHTLADLEAFFTCVRKHLLPEGRFVVDVFNPRLDILLRDSNTQYHHASYTDPKGYGSIEITESNIYDDATQLNEITLYHHFIHHPDQLLIEDKLIMRIFFPQEIDALLKYNELLIEHKFGDYQGNPFKTKSPKQLIICKTS